MTDEVPHFGKFIRRIRGKLGWTLDQFAAALRLSSREAVSDIESKPLRKMRNDTLEALLALLGYEAAEQLDAACGSNQFPDIESIKRRHAHIDAPVPAPLPTVSNLAEWMSLIPWQNAASIAFKGFSSATEADRNAAIEGLDPRELSELSRWLSSKFQERRIMNTTKPAPKKADGGQSGKKAG